MNFISIKTFYDFIKETILKPESLYLIQYLKYHVVPSTVASDLRVDIFIVYQLSIHENFL